MVFYTFSLHKGCPRKLHLAQSGNETQHFSNATNGWCWVSLPFNPAYATTGARLKYSCRQRANLTVKTGEKPPAPYLNVGHTNDKGEKSCVF
jgi:hypothetical protein